MAQEQVTVEYLKGYKGPDVLDDPFALEKSEAVDAEEMGKRSKCWQKHSNQKELADPITDQMHGGRAISMIDSFDPEDSKGYDEEKLPNGVAGPEDFANFSAALHGLVTSLDPVADVKNHREAVKRDEHFFKSNMASSQTQAQSQAKDLTNSLDMLSVLRRERQQREEVMKKMERQTEILQSMVKLLSQD